MFGGYKAPTYNGIKFLFTLVDNHTRWTWIYLLHLKSDVRTVLKNFLVMVLTQFGKIIKVLRSDNGSKFFNHTCDALVKNFDIVHQNSCTYTP